VPAKIDKFIAQVVPQFAGSNAAISSSILEQLMCYIEGRLPAENWPVEWEQAAQAGNLPVKLGRRLRSLEATLSGLEPRAGHLDEKVQRIEAAREAAENLPIDLAMLEEARAKVRDATVELDRLSNEATKDRSTVASVLEDLRRQGEEAAKLMSNIDTAYRASTSKALADAFAKRSFWLQVQTWVFVALLIAALLVAGWLGFRRVHALEGLLSREKPIATSILWMNVVISVFSIAAPVWFAWIATKQITQRFKLAEDYGFKAAVATAYEGYRREAASVDPLFVTRLFGSALSRLEEAPLRLVDAENYGSPFHELTGSSVFREALSVFPALKESYQSILASMADKMKPVARQSVSPGGEKPTIPMVVVDDPIDAAGAN